MYTVIFFLFIGGKFEAIYAGAGVGAFVIAIILLLLLGIAVLICKQCHNKQGWYIRQVVDVVYNTCHGFPNRIGNLQSL